MTVGFTSRLWKKLLQTASRHKPQRAPTAAECPSGWNRLPPELVDEILGYLSDDLPSLKTSSLTCKVMLCSARPLIRSWLYLTPTQNRKPKGRFIKSLLKRSKEGSDGFDRLITADRQGLLQHTRHLVIKTSGLSLIPQSIQPYIPHLRSITKLRTLVIDGLDVSAFMPVFNDCLGMFTHSLRSLDIKHIWDSDRELLSFISRFPLLEDLSIRYCYALYFFLGPLPPMLRTSPPFRGRLNLSLIMDSQTLCEAMAQLPGGLHFTSLELKGCGKPGAILTACQLTLRSVTYTWTTVLGKHHFTPHKRSILTVPFSRRSCPRPQRQFCTREIRIQGRPRKSLHHSGLALPNPLENQLHGIQRIHNLDPKLFERC